MTNLTVTESSHLCPRTNKWHLSAFRKGLCRYYSYKELLEKDCAVTIHTKNLQLLLIKMYKIRNDLNPSFMQEIFCENESHYNLRNNNEFVQPRVRSVGNGTESVRFKGPQLWQMLPQTIRNSGSLAQFKANIKNWKGENCPCKLCRTFIPNLGFL